MQDANQGFVRHGWWGRKALLFAILVQGGRQNSPVSALGDEGLKNAVLNHALDGANRQPQHFGGLAGAEIGLVVLAVFHGEFLEGDAEVEV